MRLTVYEFHIFDESSCLCKRKIIIFRGKISSGLGKYSMITMWYNFHWPRSIIMCFIMRWKIEGKMTKQLILLPLDKMCNLVFTGCRLQISTISLNMHQSLSMKHSWKGKNFNFDINALILEYIEYIFWIVEITDVKLILEESMYMPSWDREIKNVVI